MAVRELTRPISAGAAVAGGTLSGGTLEGGALQVMGAAATIGAALIYLLGVPALLRMSLPYGVLFAALGAVQVVVGAGVLLRPTRPRLLLGLAVALIVALQWVLAQLIRVLPPPDPWAPVNAVIGFTGQICAGLEIIGAEGLLATLVGRPHVDFGARRAALITLGFALVIASVLLASVVGVWASSDGLVGGGMPPTVVPPTNLPAGRMSTVEYCRPGGVPLAMDLYMPARSQGPVPVVLYVHGGGGLGDRKTVGLGNDLSNHYGALFSPLQARLNAEGIAVASIDYRLPPAAPWPAPIEDAKCAVRFLRAHAGGLGIDGNHIAAWGSSAGGWLAALLGLAGPEAGFDRGQYLDQSSALQGVVDMFGPADFTDLSDSSPFFRITVQLALSDSPEVRRLASPVTWAAAGAPPFLILQGADDTVVPPSQTARLAERLQAAGAPVTRLVVQGTGHTLATPDERPAPDELVTIIVGFLERQVR